jgi:ribosomal protein S6
MTAYECAFITEAGDEKLLASVEAIITQFGGKVTQKDNWGDKNFAYRMGKLTHLDLLRRFHFFEGHEKPI